MKTKLVVSILGMAAASSFGQGYIALDNYNSHSGAGGPLVSYGFGAPANGISGAVGTGGLNSTYTVGLYFAPGALSIIDPAGGGIPNAALVLGTGTGSTAQFFTTTGVLGEFSSANYFAAAGSTVGGMVTVELVAYPTSVGSYANAFNRGHSAPFVMPTVAIITAPPTYVGDYMQPFIAGVPEPNTLTLVGLGFMGLLTFRCRK